MRPDVSFVRAALAAKHDEDEYYPHSPDLAVEVLSPSDRPEKVKENVQAWLRGGAKAVWVVDGGPQTLTVFPAKGKPRVWQARETFRDEVVVPGFTIRPLGRLFQATTK